ncbi:hypothetical protein IDJ77_14845 [Mucilaginibacter sp. ZT4R22]|uniref:Uncharacterized protein n=1 Tax=Mucilaginibacter pankratovii TaxID=2772110 RepID=A0ABR7WS22_9SPHI|nr:hypothetical protein [Mucilaginibacter pankratovii]MBD1365097.1 hypothetical protein [Mucilaginibacter pankratovii]
MLQDDLQNNSTGKTLPRLNPIAAESPLLSAACSEHLPAGRQGGAEPNRSTSAPPFQNPLAHKRQPYRPGFRLYHTSSQFTHYGNNLTLGLVTT